MPVTYTLIASNVLGSDTASVTFSAIPATYTDLVLRASVRTSRSTSSDQLKITFNGDTATNYSYRTLLGDGSAASSNGIGTVSSSINYYVDGNTSVSNAFGSTEIYIPNYLAAANKPFSGFSVQETDISSAIMTAVASLWRNTAAITSIEIDQVTGPNFLTGSSFYLYGIKNS
jgi:hypothetical protein